MGTATFWFTVVLAVTLLLVPVAASRFYRSLTRPTLADRIRLKQRIMTKSKSKSGDLILRHASTRCSQRSFSRSGYAFAHEEGFGELITTGSMMRTRKRRTSTANSLKSCFPIGKSTSIKEAAVEALRNTAAARQAEAVLAGDTAGIELTDLSESGVSPRSGRRTAVMPPSRSPRSALPVTPTGKMVSVIVEETNSETHPAENLTTAMQRSYTNELGSPQNVTISEPLLSSTPRV